MALKWSEIESSADYRNADEIGKNKSREEFLSKVKPELSPEAYKLVEDKVMLKQQPSNQYGVSQPQPLPQPPPVPEAPYDIAVPGLQGNVGEMFPNAIEQAPLQSSQGANLPEVRTQDIGQMKWSDVQKSDFFNQANPQGKRELANSWLKVKEGYLSPEAYNLVRGEVNKSVNAPSPIPDRNVKDRNLTLEDKIINMFGITKDVPYTEAVRNPYGNAAPVMATREEMITAGLNKPSKTEEAIGLKEPRLKTLEEIQALQEPGFVESMLNPAEILAMGGTGAIIAKRFGKPIMATTLDYALNGLPAVAKGVKGFVKGVTQGIKGIAEIAASRNVPVSNTIDIMEKPVFDMMESVLKNDAYKSGKFIDKSYMESIPDQVKDTITKLKKYGADSGLNQEEIDMLLKTGDIPPANPLYETKLIPGPSKTAPIQGELPLETPHQLRLNLGTPKPEEPIITPGKRITVPPQGVPSGVTPDDLNHPYLGEINKRVARGFIPKFMDNPIRMFLKAGGNLKREVYDKIEDADMSALREFTDRFIPLIKEWKTKANPRRLAVYMINRQKEGSEILSKMKVNVTKELSKMTSDELAIANSMDDYYKEFYNRINVARIKSGLPEMGKVDDYFTFYRQMEWLQDNMGVNPLEVPNMEEVMKKKFIHPKSTFFGEALARKKGSHIPVELDAFRSFGRYSQNALNHINLSPEIARGRKVVQQIEKTHPEIFSDVTNWLDFVSGKVDNVIPQTIRVLGKDIPLRKMLLGTNRRVALSVLSWNFRSMLVQTAALRNTLAEAGVKDTIAGIGDVLMSAFDKNKAEFVRKNSNLLGRQFDSTVSEIMKLARGPIQKIGEVGMKPMQYLDMLTAEASWNSFMRQGKRLGLTGKDLIRHANDKVILSQASGRKQHLARIQRSDIGRLASTLQTFVINDWGFLTQDILGMGKNVPFTKANVGKIYRYAAGTILINSFYEDLLNIYSPYPTPIRATMEAIDKKDPSFWSVGSALGKELVDGVPIIGSAIKFRSGFLGPTIEAGRRLAEGDRPVEQLAKLTGIPVSFLKVPPRLMENKGVSYTLFGAKKEEKKSKSKVIKPMSSGGTIGGGNKKKGKKKKGFTVLTPLR